MKKVQVAVDTGGTFSDFTYLDESGALQSFKVPSSPAEPERAVIQGLTKIVDDGVRPDLIDLFIHGTTVGTNTLLQEHGSKTALVITEGFDAIYEVQEQARPYGKEIFNIRYQRPKLLVDRQNVIEIPERIGSKGEVVREIDLDVTRSRLETLKTENISGVAICLLFSFINPDHERAVRRIAEEVLPGVQLTLSSEICPFIREYYRLSTTVINAYLRPKMDRYLSQLDRAISDLGVLTKKRYVMQSNGGVGSITSTAERPVSTLMSGLAGGVMASLSILEKAGLAHGISFDMGGTSCDVAVTEGRVVEIRDRFDIDGRHICLPSVQVETLSAGGGTLAWVDDGGALHVGPESAGAVPGPVAYGRGGEIPTVTDCNVTLGYLGNRDEVKGHLTLDVKAAERAIQERLATPLGLSVESAALGALKVVDIKMAEAVRALATSKGLDLREFTLIAFGGAGPLHASRIMRELNLKQVLIPARPGVTSALGLLQADVKHEFISTKPQSLSQVSAETVHDIFNGIEKDAFAKFDQEGFPRSSVMLERYMDLRYQGQGYELSVAVNVDGLDTQQIRSDFDELHAKKFGHAAGSQPVEVMSYRLIGRAAPDRDQSVFDVLPISGVKGLEARVRSGIFDVDGSPEHFEMLVMQRDMMEINRIYEGPLVIEQSDTTTLVIPRQTAELDSQGNIIIKDK
ncbi:hydantoinase/oxoprolinase family protein [Litoricolaceae bacterium]|nr:hydantoinase/oxoprolinase family protein [Litorivicinaceae bacterium]